MLTVIVGPNVSEMRRLRMKSVCDDEGLVSLKGEKKALREETADRREWKKYEAVARFELVL